MTYKCPNDKKGGDAIASPRLGLCYETGSGTPEDMDKAVSCYREAAEQGDAGAQCNLGVLYRSGYGVEQNDDKAFRLFSLSAEQNWPRAQFFLGLCHEAGRGTEENMEKKKPLSATVCPTRAAMPTAPARWAYCATSVRG